MNYLSIWAFVLKTCHQTLEVRHIFSAKPVMAFGYILTYWDIFHEFIQYIKPILIMIFLRWQQCHLIALEKHGDLADLQIQVATWINIRIVLGNSFKATQTSLDDGENNTTFKSKNLHSNLQLFNVYLKKIMKWPNWLNVLKLLNLMY